MKKKICLVGGEDVHKRIELSKYLIDAGFHVTIVGTSKQVFPDYITYHSYNLKRNLSPISDYKTVLWLKKFFKKNHFDLIHTFDTKPAFLVPLAQMDNDTPITRTITGLGTIFMSKSVLNKALRFIYKRLHIHVKERVRKTIFQNLDDRDVYLKNNLISKSGYELIYSSGIELNDFKLLAKRNNTPFTFICVARVVYEKGIINLLEAAENCKNLGYDFKVLLVGPVEENTKRLNREILESYQDSVTVLGERQDVKDLLLSSDAFILPTFREGFSRVILEAAAIGLPIISTNVTGVREFARHNEEAILVEPKNTKALTQAMIRLVNDNVLRDKLVKNALKRVELFGLENVSKQYITIFDKAINCN